MSKLITCLPLASLLLLGCQKKEPENAAQVAVPEHQEEVSIQPIVADELGFATRLPQSVEFYASVHRPGEVLKGLITADITEFLFRQVEESGNDETSDGLEISYDDEDREDGEDAGLEDLDELMAELDEVLVGNAFFCFDRGLATNIETMGSLYQDMNAAQAKMLAKMVSRLLKMENPSLAGEDALMHEFLADAKSGFEDMEQKIKDGELAVAMPRLYFGCQPPKGKSQEWQQLWLATLAEMADAQAGVEKCEFKKYGAHFQGLELKLGTLIADAAEAGGEEFKEGFKEGLKSGLEDELGAEVDGLLSDGVEDALTDGGEQWVDSMIEQLHQLTLILVLGEVDGHLVFFLGENADAMHLVDDVDQSLAGKPEFLQLGQHGGQLMGAWYASDELIQSFHTWRGYEKSYRALALAFEQEKLPNSEQIIPKFSALADMEHQLLDVKIDDYLLLFVQDQGVRIESVGGRLDPGFDFTKPLKLAPVAESLQDDYLFRAHWCADQDRKAIQMDYAELLVGVIGQVIDGGCLAFLERSEGGGDWYDQATEVYQEVVVPEMSRFWNGYRQLSLQALDGESAVLIDLHGEMPRVPGVPAKFVSEGKVPRLLVARPIKDRTALGGSYEAFETTTENVLSYVSVLAETELPMPTFLSSDKGSLTTWFYPFPMMTDDFVPGVSVSDSLLMVGTSKNWAEQTYGCWQKQTDLETASSGPRGAIVEVQFEPLWDYTAHWLDLAEKEAQRLAAEEEQAIESAGADDLDDDSDDGVVDLEPEEPFDYDQARKVLKRARLFQSIRWHRRVEDEKMRSTLELKVGS